MKKMLVGILIVMLIMTFGGTCMAESNVKEYYDKLMASQKWVSIDNNVVYSNAAKNVLPSLFKNTGTSFNSSSCRVFGDQTGEVWLIYSATVYRMWWSEEGNLVLTSTSDGLGYTGYGVYKPE